MLSTLRPESAKLGLNPIQAFEELHSSGRTLRRRRKHPLERGPQHSQHQLPPSAAQQCAETLAVVEHITLDWLAIEQGGRCPIWIVIGKALLGLSDPRLVAALTYGVLVIWAN
jgi:hypothetical protein